VENDDPSPASVHEPVLLEEVTSLLDPDSEDVLLDCTFGSGGHAEVLTEHLGRDGTYIALDWDENAQSYARFDPEERACAFRLEQENFAHASDVLTRLGVDRVNGLLADLGWSTDQLRRSGLGLTFERDEFLDMRLNPEARKTAADVLHEASVDQLTELFRRHGEHRHGRAIARTIVEEREHRPVRRTLDLMDLIASSTGGGPSRDVAARVFQALRTHVNDELRSLEQLLDALPDLLAAGGRAVVISFHSLEDGRVKQMFSEGIEQGIYRRLVDGPLRPDEEEVRENPSAGSARLRAVEWREP